MPPPSTLETDQVKPIPAFYCCYLLRSSKKPGSLYIGSTPDPARRLQQHNGVGNGGAKRTEAEALRPWEMITVVEGFTSRTGALQFEWSWQHMHKCRHVDTVETDALHRRGKKPSEDKGSGIWHSAIKILGNLHQLLRSTYFKTWPLTVRFLSTEAYTHWQRWTERADGLLPDNMQIKLDFRPEGVSAICSHLPANRMIHIDATYSGIQEHLEKSSFLLGDSDMLSCEVCKKPLSAQVDAIVICSQQDCYSTSHVKCLSHVFLDQEGSSRLVPISGECPACRKHVVWAELMKELTLRLRGEKIVTKILKAERKRKANAESNILSKTGKKEARTDDYIRDNVNEEDDNILDDDWMEAVNFEIEAQSTEREIKDGKGSTGRIEIVIEDSEEESFSYKSSRCLEARFNPSDPSNFLLLG